MAKKKSPPAQCVKRLRLAVDGGDEAAIAREIETLHDLALGADTALGLRAPLMAIGSAAPLLVHGAPGTLRRFADTVVRLAEPFFDAPFNDFVEVAEGTRHRALHALMGAAAQSGDFETALVIRQAEDEANERSYQRWVLEAISTSPGTHALYPTAYGTRQLIEFLVERNDYAAVPALLSTLQGLIERNLPDTDNEARDAYGDEEAGALAAVLASPAPAALAERCIARREALRALAVPAEDWPRTIAALDAGST